MHDRKLMSCDEMDENDLVSPTIVARDLTGISDSEIHTVIALCTSSMSTLNSVVSAIEIYRDFQSQMRMSA